MDRGQSVTRAEALEAFGAHASAARFLGDTFVVTSDAVLCFFDVGAELLALRRIDWSQPVAETSAPGDGSFEDVRARILHVWPSAVVDVYERKPGAVKRIRTHQVFLGRAGHDRFVYAGRAHLDAYGLDGRASFTLAEPLPRDAWLALGGYSGWKDGEGLVVFKNERCAYVLFVREPGDGGLRLVSPPRDDARFGDESFSCDCGITLTYPATVTCSLDYALSLVRAFFALGTIDGIAEWTEDPPIA